MTVSTIFVASQLISLLNKRCLSNIAEGIFINICNGHTSLIADHQEATSRVQKRKIK